MKKEKIYCAVEMHVLANLLRDAEELRRLEMAGVDNWIGYDGAIIYGGDIDLPPFTEYSNQEDEELTKEYRKTDVSYSDIAPVTITEEILKKNGFEKIRECLDIEEYASPDRRITISSVSNTVGRNWCVHIDNEDMESIGGCDIQYVHQLQQILRLCDIKKEVML